MGALETLKQDIVSYIASFVPTRERVFTVRDFNSQVMSKTFDATARAGLGEALQELVALGVFERRTPTDYALTAKGVEYMRERRGEPAQG